MVFVESLSPEQDPSRSHVVSDVDEQECEIAASPQESREHYETADLA